MHASTAATSGAQAGHELEARDLTTGATLGRVPLTAAEQVEGVVAGSAQVQPLWSQLRLEDRARYLRRAAQAVIDEFDELCELVAREQGRPQAEVAAVELLPAIEALRWMAEAGPRVLRGRRIGAQRALFPFKQPRVEYESLGVVGVIGAHGAPFAQPLGQVAAALVAGNGAVLKPSARAALSGERIAHVLARAGLPEGLLRVIHGEAEVGRALVETELGALFFTGRAQTATEVRLACARHGRPLAAETGGGDAMLVLADANIARAAAGAAWAGFAASGQARGSLERVFVVRPVADRFLAELEAIARSLSVGPPLDPQTQIGPLPSAEQAQRVDELVNDAVGAGARLVCGGLTHVAGHAASFYLPTVLADADASMRVMNEPIGGPVLAVAIVASTAEAIAVANRCAPGIGASVWTDNRHQAARIARELRNGVVWLNDHLISPAVPEGPWGGDRGGAVGRSHGAAGLRMCAHAKLVAWDPPAGRGAWWFPYDGGLLDGWRAVVRLLSARDSDRQRGLREGLVPLGRMVMRAVRGARPR